MKKVLGLLFAFILIFTGCGNSKIGDEVTADDLIESEEWTQTADMADDGMEEFEYSNPTNGVSLIVTKYDDDGGGFMHLTINNPDIYKDELRFGSNTSTKEFYEIKDNIYIPNSSIYGESVYANLTNEELESINEHYEEKDTYKSVKLTRDDFDVEQFLKDQNMYNAFIDAINYIGYSDFTFDSYYQ